MLIFINNFLYQNNKYSIYVFKLRIHLMYFIKKQKKIIFFNFYVFPYMEMCVT